MKVKRGDGWLVGLRHPRSKFKRLGVLRLRDCALSTSGNEEQQFFDHAGRRFSHIIDPRSGWPAEGVTECERCRPNLRTQWMRLATAFFVGGRQLAETYCATHEEVLVVMLESSSQVPIVIGSSPGCDGLRDFQLGNPMTDETASRLTTFQQVALVALRTVIGWHFLYEAYYKITSPAWSPSGGPLTPWTSAGYLKGASGLTSRSSFKNWWTAD